MKQVHVAVAVIEAKNGDICIAKRAEHQHQGGLWEFPGGKVESGETITEALQREIYEELGVNVHQHNPLISVRYRYPDKHVLLDVHRVHDFSGEAHGKEGQPVIWCPKSELRNYQFPAANKGILNALLLPNRLVIIDSADSEQLTKLQDQYSPTALAMYLRNVKGVDSGVVSKLQDDGFLVMQKGDTDMRHLTSAQLMDTRTRPSVSWLSAACHNEAEVERANDLAADFIFISPVNDTPSHPDAKGIGWEQFQSLAELAHMPVYALGGVGLEDLETALAHGAQGIAGIRTFL